MFTRRLTALQFRPCSTCSLHRIRVVVCRASKETMPKPLVVVGSVNADLVVSINRLPKPGETLSASTLDTFPGGKGANQAASAACAGCHTYFVGQVGSDANAALLRTALEQAGVDLTHLRQVDGSTGTALILLQSGGENSIIIVGGANQTSWPEQLPAPLQELIAGAGAVLLQREIPDSVNLMVAKAAHAVGVPVILDAGGVDGPLDPKLLSCLTTFSPNESELARLTGMATGTLDEVTAAAEAFLAAGVQSVLVKLGAEGSLLLSGKGQRPLRQAADHVDSVVDTTGAGDCFTATYAVAVLEGRSPADALRFAAAAASLCVQRKGAMPSMPAREEIDALVAR